MRTHDDLLEALIGNWDMTGQMGSVVLHQTVQAHWALGGTQVLMTFREVDGPPYEAMYIIGRQPESGLYALVLLDSTGVNTERANALATGTREGNTVTFHFGEPTNFVNRFEWHKDQAVWTHELTVIDQDGRSKPFAHKRLSRID